MSITGKADKHTYEMAMVVAKAVVARTVQTLAETHGGCGHVPKLAWLKAQSFPQVRLRRRETHDRAKGEE